MKSSIIKKMQGSLSLYELNYGDSTVLISSFGAQAINWTVSGKEIFFSNSSLITDKTKPLRTGAPVCFPWFNKGLNWNLGKELSPSHGPARNSEWTLISEEADSNHASVEFSFETNSYLSLPLKISAKYKLSAVALRSEFTINNLSYDSINKFELALHTYFATILPQETKIFGLKGQQDPFVPNLPIDQIFDNNGDIVKANFSSYNLKIINSGFHKSVIWHPGLSHQLADLPKDASPVPFICLESLSDKIEIAAGKEWSGSVEYFVSLI